MEFILTDALNSVTRLVLVNGIYFKGLWKDQFKREHTLKSPFYLNDTDKVDVDMMYKEAKFPYGEFPDIDAHAVALPYKVYKLYTLLVNYNTVWSLDRTSGCFEILKSLRSSSRIGRSGGEIDVSQRTANLGLT